VADSTEVKRQVIRYRPVVERQIKELAEVIANDLLYYGTAWLKLEGEAVVRKGDPGDLIVKTPPSR
jgi:hypothetical protein